MGITHTFNSFIETDPVQLRSSFLFNLVLFPNFDRLLEEQKKNSGSDSFSLCKFFQKKY